ncbi:MAG TPA: hypothetical protein VK843_07185 [Planctomycetota bacterium]|nr:hypothetical protein [Planctomycetota bacterium]
MSTDDGVTLRALSSGLLRDLRMRLPNPVLALGSARLFHAQVHGEGFELFLAGETKPIRGFFTSCTVAARNPQEAGERALALIERRWQRDGHREQAGAASLEVTKIQALSGRWRSRTGGGYTFYMGA